MENINSQTKIKNVNVYILKTYWKLMRNANLCTIGGFQCLMINVNAEHILQYLACFATKKTQKCFTTDFGRWWCLYRNCLIDFIIYYHSEPLTDIDQYAVQSIAGSDDLQQQISTHDKLKVTIIPMTSFIRGTQLTKYFTHEILYSDWALPETSSAFVLPHPTEQYVTLDKKKITPFEIISGGQEAAEFHKQYIDGLICGNFTSNGDELNNIYYCYNNEYIWWYLNKLLRERNDRNDVDSFLKIGYTFPKRDGFAPIVNRGIRDMKTVDILYILFDVCRLDRHNKATDIATIYPKFDPHQEEHVYINDVEISIKEPPGCTHCV